MTAPWSPSRAREAARAALCRYRTRPIARRGAPYLIRRIHAALVADVAFDSREALRAWVRDGVPAPELLRLLEDG